MAYWQVSQRPPPGWCRRTIEVPFNFLFIWGTHHVADHVEDIAREPSYNARRQNMLRIAVMHDIATQTQDYQKKQHIDILSDDYEYPKSKHMKEINQMPLASRSGHILGERLARGRGATRKMLRSTRRSGVCYEIMWRQGLEHHLCQGRGYRKY